MNTGRKPEEGRCEWYQSIDGWGEQNLEPWNESIIMNPVPGEFLKLLVKDLK